jgi:O-acetyl-ADP-ribose deacetylase (regulator of RNase III)
MGSYKEVEGNLITLALEGAFDVVVHGCNCFCTMGAGIAPHMAKAFGCDDYPLEEEEHRGDINKLGCIEFGYHELPGKRIYPVNAYTQYGFGINHKNGSSIPLDYEALTLCMRKVNYVFKGRKIGLPAIGCGLAGGSWDIVSKIIQKELKDCDVEVILLSQNKEVKSFGESK